MSRRSSIIGGYRLTRNLRYWWDLDAGGATVTDQQSSLVLTRDRPVGGNGGITSATAAPDGGACIEFDNVAGTDRVRFLNASVPKPSAYDTAFTVNIWVRRTAAVSSAGSWLINHRDGGAGSVQYWQVTRSNTSGNATSTLVNSSNSTSVAAIASPGLNVWYMHSLVLRSGIVELWINAVKVASAAYVGPMNTGNAPYAIGGQSFGTLGITTPHQGQLWAAGQWDRALNGAEFAALYNNGNGRKFAAL